MEKKSNTKNPKDVKAFTCYSTSNYENQEPCVEIYSMNYDSQKYYAISKGKKLYGNITFFAENAVLPQTYYREPTVTYYGVSYNGMTTGTVDYNPGGTTTSLQKTEHGYVVLRIGDERFTIKAVEPSETIIDRFKRDKVFQDYFDGKALVLDRMKSAANGGGDINYMMLQSYLPMPECHRAAELLRRMTSHQLPPTDQEAYENATRLAESNESLDLQRSIEIFESISDYKDSEQQANRVRKRQKEILIVEKKRGNKKLFWGILLSAIVIIALIVYGSASSKINGEKIEEIQNLLAGKCFSSSWFEGEYNTEYIVAGYEFSDTIPGRILCRTVNPKKGVDSYHAQYSISLNQSKSDSIIISWPENNFRSHSAKIILDTDGNPISLVEGDIKYTLQK